MAVPKKPERPRAQSKRKPKGCPHELREILPKNKEFPKFTRAYIKGHEETKSKLPPTAKPNENREAIFKSN